MMGSCGIFGVMGEEYLDKLVSAGEVNVSFLAECLEICW